MTNAPAGSTARPRPRRRVLLLAAVLAVATAVVLEVGSRASTSGPAGTRPEPAVASRGAATDGSTRSDASVRRVGVDRPAKVCGSRALLGPARPPAGATRVRTTAALDELVLRSAPGTTFWLEPGVHVLGDGQYDQVQPHDGDTFIGAPGAVLDGRGRNRYAFATDAEGVTVSYLTIRNFGQGIDDNPGEGVVNHDAGNGWSIHHNTIEKNAGAGVFLGDDTRVVENCLRRNGQYGFSAYEPDGVRNVVLRGNEIARNNTADWEALQPGCGCAGGGKFWDTRGARVVGNHVHDNHGPGLWADTNNVGFLVRGNHIEGNDSYGLFYEISYNALIRDNVFVRNGWVEGPELRGFPVSAIYLSEAGSDVRAGERYGRHLRISRNRFVDNWAGIMAWENPDRFAGSPYSTSSDYTTLVNPGVATVENCSNPDLIGQPPFVDDCRWKTQHLRVVGNDFVLRPGRIPGCRAAPGCGYNGLVANYGTVPEWSPYQGFGVPDDIALRQDNVWRRNHYTGPWRFMIRALWDEVSWSTWRSAPYGQDAGSTRD